MTGNWYGYLSNQVTQYGPEGYLADLPLLNTGRHNHACAGYYTEDNIVLMVAGGKNFLTGHTKFPTDILTDLLPPLLLINFRMSPNTYSFVVSIPLVCLFNISKQRYQPAMRENIV